MNTEPYRALGRIVKTHGLKGEVSVAVAPGASLDALVGTPVWFVPPAPGVRQSTIAGVRPGPKGPLVTLSGVGSVDIAKSLCGSEILAATDALPLGWDAGPEDGDDVIGFEMTDVSHGFLGAVVETIITGANDVWVVDGPFGEVLVPVIDDVVIEVDPDARTIAVTLLDGLLPDDAGRP